MRLIKLNAIDSTNSYLKQLSAGASLKDYTVVQADYQTQGRGQMGTQWDSQATKNLMFSVFKDVSFLDYTTTFYLSMVTSLAIVKTLEGFMVPKVKVKWPNDILSENKKICGILIDNVVKQGQIKATIIGVGLNVNQTEFAMLPQASSLLLITGKVYDLDELRVSIVKHMQYYFGYLKKAEYAFLRKAYEKLLFRKDKPSTFAYPNGSTFPGVITGIAANGNLIVQLEDRVLKEFDLKEISLRY